MAIDWFEPEFWNETLTVRQRANFIQFGIYVALPEEQHCVSWAECAKWKNLSTKKFMKEYGNDVLKLYNMPTKKELEQVARWEAGEDQYDSDEDEDHSAGPPLSSPPSPRLKVHNLYFFSD